MDTTLGIYTLILNQNLKNRYKNQSKIENAPSQKKQVAGSL